jgi:hypothetical protein
MCKCIFCQSYAAYFRPAPKPFIEGGAKLAIDSGWLSIRDQDTYRMLAITESGTLLLCGVQKPNHCGVYRDSRLVNVQVLVT